MAAKEHKKVITVKDTGNGRNKIEMMQSEDGIFSIGAHGSSDFILNMSNKPIDSLDLAGIIVNYNAFKSSKAVQLWSCNTGKGDNSFAQKLADIIGEPVIAPDGFLSVLPNGTYHINKDVDVRNEVVDNNNGSWRIFYPRKMK